MRLEREEQKIDTERRKNSNVVDVGDDVTDAGFERRFETMRKIVESGRQDDAFFLCDQDRIVRNFEFWRQKLANVTPYFGELIVTSGATCQFLLNCPPWWSHYLFSPCYYITHMLSKSTVNQNISHMN